MPKIFIKNRYCGCVVSAIVCEIKEKPNGVLYMLGCHNHVNICTKCKQNEENEEDTLRDMWINDNVTDVFGYAGWNPVAK